MGSAMEILSGYVTAPSTTETAVTMGSGNSLTIRNALGRVLLLNAWGDWQTAGLLKITSPRIHDAVQGIRLEGVASEVDPLLPMEMPQLLYPQDTLTAVMTGSATSGDIESMAMLLYYENLPGAQARFISPDEVKTRMRNILTVEKSIALGTAGGWSGSAAINATYDQFKADTDYALLGYLVNVECVAVRWIGADVANLGIGGPGNETDKILTRDWFVKLSRMTGLPLIPVFNAANKTGILVDGAQDENGLDSILTSIFAELA